MQDECLLIIHTKLVPPAHPHGALTHQEPWLPLRGRAALPADATLAQSRAPCPRVTPGDNQELPGQQASPSQTPRLPDFTVSLIFAVALTS